MLPIKKNIKHPEMAGYRILQECFTWLPDKLYIQLMFRLKVGYWPDLKNPQTFSEKLQWLKLYNRRPEYTMMVDKYAVKDYVASIIGEEYIIPTFGVWDKPEDIDWDTLPDQFVLKTTHGGGSSGVVICKYKVSFDKEKAVAQLNRSMMQDIYRSLREWPYKNVPKKIIAEQYISPIQGQNDLPDYKFFCFNGEPKYCQVITGRNTEECVDFFDKDWNHQPFHEPKKYGFANPEPLRPQRLNEMWALAEKLAEGKPFSRIDFYQTDDKIYFGEITFYPTSGMGGFAPNNYDRMLGEMINLPREKRDGTIDTENSK